MHIQRLLALSVPLLLCAPAGAQAPPATACDLSQAPAAQAPTPPSSGGPSAGTDPGSAGSTGWTGGLGGSNIGTTPGGPSPSSPNAHPQTATGLNPIDGPQAQTGQSSPRPNC